MSASELARNCKKHSQQASYVYTIACINSIILDKIMVFIILIVTGPLN